MNCNEAQPLIAAYADGELDFLRKRQVERHLRHCARCAAERRSVLGLRSRLRAEVPYFAAPPGLHERIRAMIAETPPMPAGAPRAGPPSVKADPGTSHLGALRDRWPWLLGGAFAGCAATLLAFVVGTSVIDWRESRDVAAEAVATHVHATLDDALIQVASSDQHTVKPWLSARLDYSPPVRDFAGNGFPLLGGRVDTLGQRPCATLVYGYRKHRIDVFVRPKDRAVSSPARTLHGFSVVHAASADWDWLAVSDVSADVLASFVERLARDSPTP